MRGKKSNVSFGLVNIPIFLSPIIKNNDTSFHQIHKKCKNRIIYQKYCPICKVVVRANDIIKGYEYESEEYLEFTKQELDKLKPDQDGEIEIISFVKKEEVEAYYFEKSYLLTPEKAKKAYSLFVKALSKTSYYALCKTVLYNKFYYGILRVYQENLIFTTLYFEEEVKIDAKEINQKINSKELELAMKLISSMKGKFEPQKYKDEYEQNIKKSIQDKLKGNKIKGKKKNLERQVDNLMKALEKSLK